MNFEDTGMGKFTELMTYHIFSNENSLESFSVMYAESMSYEFRYYHRTARPGLDRLLAARSGLHLLDEVVIDERALLE